MSISKVVTSQTGTLQNQTPSGTVSLSSQVAPGNETVAPCQGRAERERSDPEWSGITPEWKGVDNKVGEQPWPQLVHYALICCRVCGCIFQED